MRCRYCGANIPDGILHCKECGGEVQIVPDYNPLEDMLAAHVKDALKNSHKASKGGVRSRANAEYGNSGRTAALRSDSMRGAEGRTSAIGSGGRTGYMDGGRTSAMRSGGRTGYIDGGRTSAMRGGGSRTGYMDGGRTSAMRSGGGRTGYIDGGRTSAMRGGGGRTGYIDGGRTSAMRGGGSRTGYITDGRSRRYTGNTAMLQEEWEAQRKQAERRKALKKKKRRKALSVLFFLIVIVLGILAGLFINSYAGKVYLGNRALRNGEYTKAEEYFQRAIGKDKKKAEGYAGLSKVYIAQNDVNSAEKLFLDVIEEQPENVAVYEAAFEFYLDTKQPMGIPALFKDAKSIVSEELPDYVVHEPEFSLDDTETYDDVQQLTLTSKEGEIRYTTDGSMPDTQSTVFTEPIQLGEGSNVIKAIVVNKEGVPSQTSEKEFTVELPIEDAPAVSPSTGQYDSERLIEIKVPEGYTAYYTIDGTDPTTASTPYKDALKMPKGETLFKAILVTKSGRVSGITTRNYVRE